MKLKYGGCIRDITAKSLRKFWGFSFFTPLLSNQAGLEPASSSPVRTTHARNPAKTRVTVLFWAVIGLLWGHTYKKSSKNSWVCGERYHYRINSALSLMPAALTISNNSRLSVFGVTLFRITSI